MYSILIVDDERIERNGIEKLIHRLNLPLQAEQAENGEVALEKLRRRRYDLLLTDIKMPFMDGLALIHEARLIHPELVILIFSGYSDFEKAQTAIEEQVYRYILKPINVSEFKTTMQSCIDDLEKARASAQEMNRMTEDLTRYRRREARLRSCLQEETDDAIAKERVEQLLKDDAPPGVTAEIDNPAIVQVLEIIQKEYMRGIGLEEIAKRVNLSSGYLSALFRQQIGQSYVKYLNNYRLDAAARMLAETNLKINDIAEKVGFPGGSYFISLFKQRFGLTPRNFRMQMREK